MRDTLANGGLEMEKKMGGVDCREDERVRWPGGLLFWPRAVWVCSKNEGTAFGKGNVWLASEKCKGGGRL